jgi:hypothetical protein
VGDDVARLQAALAEVEEEARGLRWANKRPWRARTHVRWESSMPALDGHDLSAKLFKQALQVVVVQAEALDQGAVLLITGRGRHSIGPGGVLGEVLQGALGPVAEERGWRLRPHGAGAWVLVIDPARAPDAVTGRLGWGMWLLFGLFGAAAVVAVLRAVGWW